MQNVDSFPVRGCLHADHMPESRFDDWIAERYEALWPELFEPSALEPAVEFLATLVGTGRPHSSPASVPAGSRFR